MDISSLGKESYINLETFRKNGEGVKTPVWVVGKNGKLYVWTVADSWKVKRIRNNSQVHVAKSDARGNTDGSWLPAQARILETSDADQQMQRDLAGKYGLMFRFIQLSQRLRGAGKVKRVVIEIS
ncbi:MAG: PPOX class F420-dependent oxidoreductase [Anaerolineae bacterium]|nr:PPOX class F420-dependent oxidoreductase [Anaerolineae bacterium]